MLNRLRTSLFSSLRKQLIIGTVMTVALIMMLFVWDITHRQVLLEKSHNSAQASALANSLATSSGVWVLARDFSGLQEIIIGISRYPNLRHAIVLDLNGQVLAHNDPTKIGLYMNDLPQKSEQQVLQESATLLDVIDPIILADKQIGWARIGLDLTAFNAEVAEIWQNGLIYALTAIILTVIFSMQASRFLTRRLYVIQEVADAVQNGETGIRAVVSGDDEAANLARQFNAMLDSLAQRDEQLKSFYELDLVGLAITSPQKGWVRINECLCTMLEYSEQELRRLTWEELTHPEDLAADVAQFTRLLANEIDGYRLEKRFISRTGKIIPTRLVVRCVRNIGGGIGFITAMVEDISEQKLSEENREIAENRLNLALEASDIGVWDLDLIHDKAWRSLKHDQIFGYDSLQPEWGEAVFLQHVAPDDLEIFRQGFKDAHQTGKLFFECQIIHKDQTWHWINVHGRVLYNESAEPMRMIGTVSDITARKMVEKEMAIAATIFDSQEGMTVTDADKLILRVNNAFTRISGYSQEEAVGKNPRILKSGLHDESFYQAMWESIDTKGVWEGEIWNRRKNGDVYPEYLVITAVKDKQDRVVNYVATFNDISVIKAAEDEIRSLAYFDPLTSLPNRRLLMDRLKQALASSARSGKEGALLFLDLDNFKALNDTLGHDTGDLLLIQVAERLQACVREGDTVARLGGDEFVVMLKDLSNQTLEAAAQTEIIANKILESLNQPYLLGSHIYNNSPSIGITLFNNQEIYAENRGDDLLKQADIAMYQAKNAGRNNVRFFDMQMQKNIMERAAMEADLRHALAENQFSLFYQIQIDKNNHVIGAEALIRWEHPSNGLISPIDFIPLAEESGLILPIGKWVLESACQLLRVWQQNDLTRQLILSINVSAKQFHQPDFVDQVCSAVQNHAVPSNRLKLELTESMFLDDIEDTIEKMNSLKDIGIQFSMDDFGTGYSSLQYLKRLPIHQLKIDQSFVREIAVDGSDQAIVRTIIAMAETLNLNVIAEGVETDEQKQFLLNIGCSQYQGYLFSKPVPIEQFELLLRTR